ncbi:PepSY domain-containing protein [Leptotrichia sp. OH3620_COT-345]|uniref:PepSY domain-containing protein n=1 Tax=Leptotrichia sp. OH3620_COT-345 TaxID=2491048 RepID=UPI00131551CE|nr:PepSY domain-containing protein [Leptotrichia sp. OH3620_COT-345]
MKIGFLKIILAGIIFFSGTVFSDNKGAGVKISNTNVKITTEKAKQIIFSHSGVLRKEAKITKIMLNRENRKYFYIIEFFTKNKKYSYEIDADTGYILKYANKNRKSAENRRVFKGLFKEILGL